MEGKADVWSGDNSIRGRGLWIGGGLELLLLWRWGGALLIDWKGIVEKVVEEDRLIGEGWVRLMTRGAVSTFSLSLVDSIHLIPVVVALTIRLPELDVCSLSDFHLFLPNA